VDRRRSASIGEDLRSPWHRAVPAESPGEGAKAPLCRPTSWRATSSIVLNLVIGWTPVSPATDRPPKILRRRLSV